MIKYLILTSLFCLIFSITDVSANDNVVITADSIIVVIKDHINNGQFDSVVSGAELLMTYILKNDLSSYQAIANDYLGQAYFSLGIMDSAMKYLQKANFLYDKEISAQQKAKINIRIGYILRASSKNRDAIPFYREAIRLFNNNIDTLWLGVANDHLAHIYFETGNYFLSLKHFQKAIVMFKRIGNLVNVGAEYNAMGLIYRKTGNRAKEIESYQNAIHILKDQDETIYLAEAYSNLSELYLEDGRTEEGFEMLEKSRKIYENLDYPLGLASYYAVLSFYYNNQEPPDYEKVIEYAATGGEIALQNESYRQYADAMYYLGVAYLKTNQMDKARLALEKGYKKAEHYEYYPEMERLARELSVVYKTLKRPGKAMEYLEKHLMLRDSLAGEERIKEFTNLDLTYQFKQEQLRDSLMQEQRRVELVYAHEKDLRNQRRLQYVLGFGLVMIVIVALFVYTDSRRRKLQNKILEDKNQIINKALEERELLLKEIHHRVKNNFQTISSLLELQSREVEDEKAIANIEEGQSRIRSMAMIHQKLYQNSDLSVIDMKDYIRQLTNQILYNHAIENVDLKLEAEDILLDIDTSIPIGLILNELITNSCKYAFREGAGHRLTIGITKREDGSYMLVHHDTGPGLPVNLVPEKVNTLGLRLVRRLARQLHGNFNYAYQGGSRFEIVFYDTEYRKATD